MSNRYTHEELVAIGRRVVLASPTLILEIDGEATGIAGCGSLVQFGAVAPNGATFEAAAIKPSSPDFIPGNKKFCDSLGLTHERLMREGEEVSAAMRRFVAWTNAQLKAAGKKRAVLSAFNATFDCSFVNLELHKAGLGRPFGNSGAGLCSKSMSIVLTGNYDWAGTIKTLLPEVTRPNREFTHNALEDALYQQEQHFAMIGLLVKAGLIRDPGR